MTIAKRKDLSLGKYDISKARYRELKYFCMQYDEKKSIIDYGIKAATNDGMPHGSFNTSSPVEKQAMENELAKKDVLLIEDTINKTVQGEHMRKCLLAAVTTGTTYEYMDVPCGRRQFYELRRRFFYLLSLKR